MAKEKGWISIHRSLEEHWLWEDKPFSKAHAWIDLLMMMNHEDRKVPLGNELIEVKRGSRITSIRQLCDRWGWSNTKVKKFLEMLEQDEMLHVKSDTKKTILTVVNYNVYQPSKDSENDEKATEKRHESDTETTQKHTNNNDNNDNNDNKIYILSSDEEAFISVLKSVQNYPIDLEKDLDMLKRLKERYPTLDLLASIKDWANYKLDQPLKPKSNPRSQINTAFGKYVEWGRNIMKGGNSSGTNRSYGSTDSEGSTKVKFDKSRFYA